jgi:hypothetical protein
MATTIDTNIVQKYITNVKVASDVLSGISYDKEIDGEILEELGKTDKTIEDIISQRLTSIKNGASAFIENTPDAKFEKYMGLEDYTKLPKVMSFSSINNNRFIELENGKNILVSVPGDTNKGLFAYQLDEVNGKLLKILEIPEISEEEDVRKMNSFDLFDIIWNTKEKAYQIFWVSDGDYKIRSAKINTETKTIKDIEIITNNTSQKSGRLRANMNIDGDIVVFTSSKASDGYYYGIVISKERSLNSWQTTDLLKHNGNNHDYGAYGKVQIIGSDFFYVFSDSTSRLYFVRITNSDNQLITSTVAEMSDLNNPTCQKYSQYDSASDTTDHYIVVTIENSNPRVIKVQNDLSISKLDKMPSCSSYRTPYIFTKDGITQLTNRFTRNFGEQWTENQLSTSIGAHNIESQKYIIIHKENRLFFLVNVEEIVKFNKELKVK